MLKVYIRDQIEIVQPGCKSMPIGQSLDLVFFVVAWRYSVISLKPAGKRRLILVSGMFCYQVYRHIGIGQQSPGLFHSGHE